MWLHDVCCLKGPLACFGVCNKAVKIILFENILDSQGEQGECINESSGDLLVGALWSSRQIQKDEKVLELKARRLLNAERILSTRLWMLIGALGQKLESINWYKRHCASSCIVVATMKLLNYELLSLIQIAVLYHRFACNCAIG